MKQTNSTQKLAMFGRLFLRLLVVAVVTFAAANLASFAAFPDKQGSPQQSPADATFWGDPAESGEIAVTQEATPQTPQLPEPSYKPPRVGAAGYIVADVESGHIFASKQSSVSRPIASITKLMTAVVAQETLSFNQPIPISPQAVATYGYAGGLVAGQTFPLKTMYYPLLLESSNDAAVAIAEAGRGKTFMNLMNRKATALGMGNTRFSEPSGLSEKNVSSPNDLLSLTRYITNRKSFIFDTTTKRQATAESPYGDGLRNWTNNNPMVGLDGYVGGKNGYTDEARHTLLSLFKVNIAGESRTVAIIVLGSETHVEDVANLLAWSKAAF